MLYEIPSLRTAKKEVFELLRRELSSRKVYVYPVTDTLVFAFGSQPMLEDLKYGKFLRELFSGEESFLALFKKNGSVFGVAKDDKGNVKVYRVPANPEAVASVLKSATENGIGKVYFYKDLELRELLKKAVEILRKAKGDESFLKGSIKPFEVEVSETELEEVITERDLGEILLSRLKELKQKMPLKTLVLLSLSFSLAAGVYYGYKLKKERERVVVKKKKILPREVDKNLAFYRFLEKEGEELTSFSYDGEKVVYSAKEPIRGAVGKIDNLYFGEFTISARRGKERPCRITIKTLEELNGEGSLKPLSFVFKGKLEDLKNVLCVDRSIKVEGLKGEEGWYFRVSE